jgi:hypothetical protein
MRKRHTTAKTQPLSKNLETLTITSIDDLKANKKYDRRGEYFKGRNSRDVPIEKLYSLHLGKALFSAIRNIPPSI